MRQHYFKHKVEESNFNCKFLAPILHRILTIIYNCVVFIALYPNCIFFAIF